MLNTEIVASLMEVDGKLFSEEDLAAVTSGITLLDAIRPGWREMVVVQHLHIALADRCILAQVYQTNYGEAMSIVERAFILTVGPAKEWELLIETNEIITHPSDFGFSPPITREKNQQKLWEMEIQNRSISKNFYIGE